MLKTKNNNRKTFARTKINFSLHNFTFPFKYLSGPSSALSGRQRAPIPGAASLTAPRTAALVPPGNACYLLRSRTAAHRSSFSFMPQAWPAISYGPRPRRTGLLSLYHAPGMACYLLRSQTAAHKTFYH